jgi:hypothetical protein
MQNIDQKASFLKREYIPLLKTLTPDAERKWGKMNMQQMVEHMSDSVRIANGKDPHTLVTPEENLEKMQAFLMSDKPFKENTPNRLLPDDPAEHRHADISAAIAELDGEIQDFFKAFGQDKEKTIMNPFFGALTLDMWVQLLHKHAWHHLKQFGVTPNNEIPTV